MHTLMHTSVEDNDSAGPVESDKHGVESLDGGDDDGNESSVPSYHDPSYYDEWGAAEDGGNGDGDDGDGDAGLNSWDEEVHSAHHEDQGDLDDDNSLPFFVGQKNISKLDSQSWSSVARVVKRAGLSIFQGDLDKDDPNADDSDLDSDASDHRGAASGAASTTPHPPSPDLMFLIPVPTSIQPLVDDKLDLTADVDAVISLGPDLVDVVSSLTMQCCSCHHPTKHSRQNCRIISKLSITC